MRVGESEKAGLPVQGAGGDQEEHAIDDHEQEHRSMEIESLGPVLQEALGVADPRPGHTWGSLLQQLVGQEDGGGEEEAPAPGHQRVQQVLEGGRASAGHPRPHEGPAEVEAHDGHPGEHGHSQEVAGVAEKPGGGESLAGALPADSWR